jgi:hypothetical protein
MSRITGYKIKKMATGKSSSDRVIWRLQSVDDDTTSWSTVALIIGSTWRNSSLLEFTIMRVQQ